ncbi:hypothetical protein PENTCL1PPCAC_21680, partial [Pristionchus entomophagus]
SALSDTSRLAMSLRSYLQTVWPFHSPLPPGRVRHLAAAAEVAAISRQAKDSPPWAPASLRRHR